MRMTPIRSLPSRALDMEVKMELNTVTIESGERKVELTSESGAGLGEQLELKLEGSYNAIASDEAVRSVKTIMREFIRLRLDAETVSSLLEVAAIHNSDIRAAVVALERSIKKR